MRRPPPGRALLLTAIVLLAAALARPAPSAGGPAPATTGEGERRPIALLGAFGAEVELLRGAVLDTHEVRPLGVRCTLGRLHGQPVVVAETGVGKVNAAATTALVLHSFHPSDVIFTGIAGGVAAALHPGDIVIGERLVQHDLVAIEADSVRSIAVRDPASGERHPIFFESDSGLVRMAEASARHLALPPLPGKDGAGRAPRIVRGVIATGDAFVASPAKKEDLRRRFGADAVEMEGAAVAQVCRQAGVPFLVVRSLSDTADETAEEDIEEFYRIAAHNSAALVMRLVEDLARVERESASPEGSRR